MDAATSCNIATTSSPGPEVAFRETQKALAMISEHVNKGIVSMKYLNEYEQSKNRIFKK